jgi:general stress protein 26
MMTADVTEGGTMSFITATESGKIDEILDDPHVCVTFQHDGAFLAVSGTAEVDRDRAELERVWTAGSEVWFSGSGASRAALIVVTPHFAEYWDNRGLNGLKYAFEAVRAVVTGREPDVSKDQHGMVNSSQSQTQ